jgi:hypothetical protein
MPAGAVTAAVARHGRIAEFEVAAINQHAKKLHSEMSDALSFRPVRLFGYVSRLVHRFESG